MRSSLWVWFALAAAPLAAQEARSVERWTLAEPTGSLRLNLGILNDMGVTLSPARDAGTGGYAAYPLAVSGTLSARAPHGAYKAVESGALQLDGPTLRWAGGSATFTGATLRMGDAVAMTVSGADGTPLFHGTHGHVRADRDQGTIRFFNVDLRLAPELAARVGDARLAGQPIGQIELNMRAAVPDAAPPPVPDGACSSANYGAPHNDVALIDATFASVARGGGFVAVAPASMLKNVGTTEVPWIEKFFPAGPPYNVDQHPYLIWNMYRVANGALQQIGVSALKHAFLTVNTNCACSPGSILWVNCEDTYGVENNDSEFDLGPRVELNPKTGVWKRCGSLYDPNCDNVQNFPGAFSGPTDFRRMPVLETDLQTAGAQYFVDSWYIVRDDVNIYNTMGWRRVTPTLAGQTWVFPNQTALAAGPIVDAWVNPAAPGPNADNRRIAHASGNVSLAVRATDLGGGQWRYDYAVNTHDFHRMLRSLALPVPGGASVTNLTFHDVDRDASTDWAGSVSGGFVRWDVPTDTPARLATFAQKWGTLYSFSFQTNVAPSAAGAMTARLGILQGGGELTVGILGPNTP